MHGSLHHVEIYVSNLKKSTDFWKWLLVEKLQYTVFQQWPEGISFKLENTYLVFVQTEPSFLENQYHRKSTGLNHLAFHGSSSIFINELTVELKLRGIKILYENKHPYAGGKDYYAVFFEDPDKIKVEVVA